MERHEADVLLARVERLERRMRVVVAGWVVSVAVFVLLGVAVQRAVSQSEVLRAQRIEVVDAAGRERIRLSVHPLDGSALLSMRDNAGRLRILLAALPEGRLSLLDADARLQIALGFLPDGTGLGFWDTAGRIRAMLTLRPDGSPWLSLQDAAGRVQFRAP